MPDTESSIHNFEHGFRELPRTEPSGVRVVLGVSTIFSRTFDLESFLQLEAGMRLECAVPVPGTPLICSNVGSPPIRGISVRGCITAFVFSCGTEAELGLGLEVPTRCGVLLDGISGRASRDGQARSVLSDEPLADE